MARRWGAFWAKPRPRAGRPNAAALHRRLGRAPDPVCASGRKLASTFWGRAWCENLERYHDYSNRLPRGRTYLRQGAIVDLELAAGRVTALVTGSALYEVRIDIEPVSPGHVSKLRERCAGGLSSVVALLEGRIDDDVMAAVTEPQSGLFPEPSQIRLSCSCPDWATMCKHVAAVLYGIGVRLDRQPELLFTLRDVKPDALVNLTADLATAMRPPDAGATLDAADLSAIFGVTIADTPSLGHALEQAGSQQPSKLADAPPRGRARERAETDCRHPNEHAQWTLAELARQSNRSLEEIVAFALDLVLRSPSDRPPHPRPDLRPRPRPSAARPSKQQPLDDLVLQVLRDRGYPMSGPELRSIMGTTPTALRAALLRLVERDAIRWSGRARTIRYWPT
jgi:uncharacterized Zn finger protein